MEPGEFETAADLYHALLAVAARSDVLDAAGRLSARTDPANISWRDIDAAVAAARAGLEVAVSALAWIDTPPSP